MDRNSKEIIDREEEAEPVLDKIQKNIHTEVVEKPTIIEKREQKIIEVHEQPIERIIEHPTEERVIKDEPVSVEIGKEESQLETEKILRELREDTGDGVKRPESYANIRREDIKDIINQVHITETHITPVIIAEEGKKPVVEFQETTVEKVEERPVSVEEKKRISSEERPVVESPITVEEKKVEKTKPATTVSEPESVTTSTTVETMTTTQPVETIVTESQEDMSLHPTSTPPQPQKKATFVERVKNFFRGKKKANRPAQARPVSTEV